MALLSSFNEDRPVSYFRGYPIYCSTILTIGYALGTVLTALGEAAGMRLDVFQFSPSRSIFEGQIWQIFTCTFVNPPSFFSIFNLLFIYFAAVETEKYVGKSRFLTLYCANLAIPLLLITAAELLFSRSELYVEYLYAGNFDVSIGFFIAYCTLYPGLQWFGLIRLQWLAIGGLVLGTLIDLSQHQWMSLLILLSVSGFSFGFIRFLQQGGSLPSFPTLFRVRPKPKLRVVPRPRSAGPVSPRRSAEIPEIDQLLEKISKHGLASLTPAERGALERAREKLLENDQK